MKKVYKLWALLTLSAGVMLLAGCGDETIISDVQNYTCEATESESYELSEQVLPESEESVIVTEPECEEIVICMVGDVLMHTPVSESGVYEDGSIDYSHLFYNTKDIISKSDLAIVNQEVILGGEELGITGYPTFNARTQLGDSLADAGFDVICHATNHCLDKGYKGIDNTLNFWKSNYPDIDVVGIYQSPDESETICVREVEGIKIAVLNYTYGTNGISIPTDKPYCVSLLDKNRITQDIEWAKDNSDFIIVCPHWGTEYKHEPDASQKELADFLASQGVDLILGTHPHVIEPYGYVGDTLCYYSLGNYVNATSGVGNGVADRMLGEIAKVTLSLSDGKVEIKDYDAIPIVSHLDTSAPGQITVYPLEEYTEELSKQNEIIKQDPNFSLEYLKKLWASCNNM